MSKASTKATEKYQASVGMATKSYKLKAACAEAFKAACEAKGESQAAVLTRLMAEYVSDKNSVPCVFCRIKANFKQKKGAN